MDRFFTAALVATSLAPYIALPVGQNTNIPAASLIAAVVVFRELSNCVRLIHPYLIVSLIPLLATFATMTVAGAQPNIIALGTWIFFTLPLLAFAAIGRRRPASLIRPLQIFLWVSCIFAIVQKFVYLDRGTIPFLSYYRMPGYASVEASAQTIVTYVKRPFGLFPEPSFMTGTLMLAFSAIVLLLYTTKKRTSLYDLILGILLIYVLYLSRSGAAVIGCGLIAVMLANTFNSRWQRLMLLATAGVVAAIAAVQTLGIRNTSQNWSWDDRITSIRAALRYQFSDLSSLLFGVGRGNTESFFVNGDISLAGYKYFHEIPDIYSVLGRVLFENGLVFGLVIVVLLLRSIMLMRPQIGLVTTACVALAWVVVAGLAVSYDSATWIWALPGLCLGLQHHKQTESPG